MSYKLKANAKSYKLHTPFRISRGVKETAEVVEVTLFQGDRTGEGECVPYARYGESVETVLAQILNFKEIIETGISRKQLLDLLPPGAARNAIDCALWSLEAGKRPKPSHIFSAQTVPLAEAEEMAKTARHLKSSVLKLKLGGAEDLDKLKAVHQASPTKRIIIDANEGWTIDTLDGFMPEFLECGVKMIEQPLPAGEDDPLRGYQSPIPIYADESAHTSEDLADLKGKYTGVNIKLDKTGGVLEAQRMKQKAVGLGFEIMIGCMVCSSLSIRPALELVENAKWIDLDGAYWLENDPRPLIDYAFFERGAGFPVELI